MAVAFALNGPYPAAPFSSALPVRPQAGCRPQESDRHEPAQAHHIRFWALSLERAERTRSAKPEFWLNIDRPPLLAPALWIGAGTRDTGISLTKLTFQVTHATDSEHQRGASSFITGQLKRSGVIGEVRWHQEGERLNLGRVNHYVADHEVAVATLA